MLFAISCYLLFACDFILVDESRAEINYKLELWREPIESKGFQISKTKLNIWSVTLAIEGKGVKNSNHCRRRSSATRINYTKYREIEEYVAHRIKTYWLKLRNASGILCDR